MGTADRGGQAARQDPAGRPAADDRGHFWRHQNGAKWRSVPSELGPWWRAAQLLIRWAKQGVWERVLEVVQQRSLVLGMSVLDGTSIRAHPKAAGAPKRGATATSETCVKRLAALAAAPEPRRA